MLLLLCPSDFSMFSPISDSGLLLLRPIRTCATEKEEAGRRKKKEGGRMFNILCHQENKNKNYLGFYLTPVRTVKQMTVHAGVDVGKWELTHRWWECKLLQLQWKSEWQFLRKLGIGLPQDPAISLLGIFKALSIPCDRDTCSSMFIACMLIIARSCKHPRCLSPKEWIMKKWYIYPMEYNI